MDLFTRLELFAGQFPDKLAYGFVEKEGGLSEELSYQTLMEAILGASDQLQCICKPHSRVIILLPAEAAFIKIFLGSLHAGLIAVPCPIGYSEPAIQRILNIIEDCKASMIITNRKTLKMLSQRQTEASKHLRDLPIGWFFTDDLNNEISGQTPKHTTLPDEPAYLQYTSGSTGSPKGVMVSHANLTANLNAINNCFGRTSLDTSLTWLPHYHDMGLVDGLLSPIFTGGTGLVISPILFITKPVLLLETISRHKAGFCGGPGFGLDHCVARIKPEQLQSLDLSSLRVLYVGAEPIRIASLEQFAETMQVTGFKPDSLVPAYGLAEATLAVSLHLHATPMIFRPISETNPKMVVACGPPVEFTNVVIAEPEQGLILEDGQIGEIWVKNDGVALGYWEKPAATAATFQAFTVCGKGPFLRTGDLGFLADGQLFITGRKKELIIIRGTNYYPQDIEEVVVSCHEHIQPHGTAAFSIETDQGEELMIVSEVKNNALNEADEHSIKTNIANSVGLAFGLVPHKIVLAPVGKLPKTSSGKIQRLKARSVFHIT
ncbi:fatty acyl-AMP ligase [Dyadobacter psychrophilus]|uniref:Acyl-CoA synthetase (AMP-forming)/AMP-acid ligase II n=1 Tax=Dyadobacter psychrophilus TaxID=651661 RepID=A0A1T5GK41_9BACT|nr:fatty acyl-AMP ligase [Dyadobacter psychrophilus]SKC08785.1 Acyl-CoA synthetase (AMP-forming)/AMP-acid ligase II [Dyadobacter psychrophilus]